MESFPVSSSTWACKVCTDEEKWWALRHGLHVFVPLNFLGSMPCLSLYTFVNREHGGVVVEHQTLNREVQGSITQTAPCCVLEQDTLTPYSWLNPGNVGSIPT